MSTTRYYPTDLTEAQWTLRLGLLPARKGRPGGPGRPPCDLRQVRKGIFSLLQTGGQGRLRPREFGKGNTLSASCKGWRQAGVWAKLREALRQLARPRQGRQPEPSAGRGDRQSIKTAPQATAVGCDGGTQGKGRNRPRLVDTLGLGSAGVGTAANTAARVGCRLLLPPYLGGGQAVTEAVGRGGRSSGVAEAVGARLEAHAENRFGGDE
jgi:transposase